ncbi:MAG: cell wall hydrolase, partial [Syntrophomonadaceae bacterium]
KEGDIIRQLIRSMLLLATVFFFVNVIPGLAAEAADQGAENPAQNPPVEESGGQQGPAYVATLNSYLENINQVVGSQTINAVKDIQARYRLTPGGIVVMEEPDELTDPAAPDSRSNSNPSRGGRSRALLLCSSQDLESLARTVYGEARGESFEGQVAVAAVVLNRVESGQFGSNIRAVIFQRNAFTAVNDGQYYMQPNEASYEAARAALNGWDPTNGALYYWNPAIATSRWVRTRTVTSSIGNHVFAV